MNQLLNITTFTASFLFLCTQCQDFAFPTTKLSQSLHIAGSVLTLYHSVWTFCYMIFIPMDHWRSILLTWWWRKENWGIPADTNTGTNTSTCLVIKSVCLPFPVALNICAEAMNTSVKQPVYVTCFQSKWCRSLTHHNRSGIHNKNTIAVNDCVQTMGNCQHCAINESVTKCWLDQLISSTIRYIIIRH